MCCLGVGTLAAPVSGSPRWASRTSPNVTKSHMELSGDTGDNMAALCLTPHVCKRCEINTDLADFNIANQELFIASGGIFVRRLSLHGCP